jgi:hypothetical protein
MEKENPNHSAMSLPLNNSQSGKGSSTTVRGYPHGIYEVRMLKTLLDKCIKGDLRKVK